MQFNAIAEVDVALTARRSGVWLARLAGYHPAAGRAERGTAEVVITLDADYFEVAATEALAVLRRALGDLLSFTVMPTAEYDRRNATPEVISIEMMSTREVAETLGVTKQRVQQLAADDVLPSAPFGNQLAFPRSAVERYAAAHAE